MELRILRCIDDVAADDWDRLNVGDYPFLRHGFLAALEHHGAVSGRTGWLPYHLTLYDGKSLLAAAAAYLKMHSWGEFVFDFAWADAYERNGLEYYPKLVVAVPYTPATGPRVLTSPGRDREELVDAMAAGVKEAVKQAGLSSAHWLFPRPADAARLANTGYSIRFGCQYHWYNAGYQDFDDFTSTLTSKKRKNIRRERRRVHEAGLRIDVVHGDEADAALWTDLHGFYRKTFHEHGNLPLISQACFEAMADELGSDMVLMVARADDLTVAGAICFRDRDTLYGRYWGTSREYDGLHFETCYYKGIEYCIAHGLSRFEPGAQGEHKVARGFLPTITRSAHYLSDARFQDAVEDFVRRERDAVGTYAQTLALEGPYREEILRTRLGHALP